MFSSWSKIAWRVHMLLGSNPFGLRARLAAMRPGGGNIKYAIRHSCRTDRDGREYFHLGDQRFYFEPPYPVRDRERLRQGTTLVLAEAIGEPEEMFNEHVWLREGDVVLDVGGHIGTSAIGFARRVGPGGHVFSFEPVMHQALRENLRVNGIASVTVVPKAVGDTVRTDEITVDDVAIDSTIARARGTGVARGTTIPVEVTTLDAFVAERGLERVDLIKLDIEGAEDMAIRGAAEVVRRFRPRWTIASYHIDFEGQPQHAKLVRQLEALGYRIDEIVHGGRGVRIFAW